jgi:O-antigen/teichoic acid export membrane protein
MALLGRVATVGLGTVLISELPGREGDERRLIHGAMAVAGTVGAVLGIAFISIAVWVAPDLSGIANPVGVALFAAGVMATAAAFVLDAAFIGVSRPGLQFRRNVLAAAIKLLALVATGVMVAALDAPILLFGWVLGTALSLAPLVAIARTPRGPTRRSAGRLPRDMGLLALRHHALNLSILAPGLLLPVVVTAVLSSETNAYFYIAFTVAGLGLAIPNALSTALYAAGARDSAALRDRVRLSFRLCMVAAIAVNAFVLVAAEPLLSVFGERYAQEAGNALRLLTLSMFPVTIIGLYVPIARIEGRFLRASSIMLAALVLQITTVTLGARWIGLDGVAIGWLFGTTVSSAVLLPTVWRVAWRRRGDGSAAAADTDAADRRFRDDI